MIDADYQPIGTVLMDTLPAELIEINDNGAWCWFQDERTLYDPANQTVLVGSVAAPEGRGGASRAGNVELAVVHVATGERRIVVLHEQLEADDHDVPALWLRPDGRYLAMYTKHKTDNLSRWRISTRPHDASEWTPERTFDWSELADNRGVSYSNLHYLQAERRLYNFVRAINDDPCIMISDDWGDTWRYGGKLLTIPKVGYVNGYTRYSGNGVDRVDFITTEHHPRNFNNSIYHGYLHGGRLHRADGSVVNDAVVDGEGVPQTLLTKIFSAGTVVDGEPMTHGWTTDLRRGPDGQLAALLTCRANDVPEDSNFDDHRFFYARFDGTSWQTHQIARAGAALWPAEQDYTGLGVVDPHDLDTIYLSSTIDPRDGRSLRHHEIYRGITADGGNSWEWSAITADSDRDNLRPIVVPGDPASTTLLWFRGTMTRSQHFDMTVVGTLRAPTG